MPTPGRLGRLPNDPTKPRLLLGKHLRGSLPPNPATVDWLSKIPSWPMYLNDRIGDCVFAALGHMIMALSTYGHGTTITVTDADILKGYEDVTGYNPNDPATDQGTVIQDALDYWRKTGIAGHKILAFAEVDPQNQAEVDAALSLFGTLILGVNLPASAMSQFHRGQPWTVTKYGGGILGGHALNAGSYTLLPATSKAVTWGVVQEIDNHWWAKYVEEAWVVISPEWLDATGHSPMGLDLQALGDDFTALTGKPNPFPTDPDHLFAAALHEWLSRRHIGNNRAMAIKAQAWLQAKGL